MTNAEMIWLGGAFLLILLIPALAAVIERMEDQNANVPKYPLD